MFCYVIVQNGYSNTYQFSIQDGLPCGENYGNGIEYKYGRNSQYVCLGHIAYEHEQSVHIDILIDH